MNVLISSSGRRVSLVQIFIKSLSDSNGEVFCCDADPLAPTLRIRPDNAILVPRLDNVKFKQMLFKLVVENSIKMIIPTIDTELSFYAENKVSLKELGCEVIISSQTFVNICNDKWKTYNVFKELGVDVPKSFLPGDVEIESLDKLFIKPRAGSASVGAQITSIENLTQDLSKLTNPIIQECLQGMEITVDCLLKSSGEPVYFVPRYRIRTLAGESIQSKTLEREGLFEKIIQNILTECGKLGATGPLTLQFFKTSERITLLEINPRFGGGYPLSYEAGGYFPDWILDEFGLSTNKKKLPYVEHLVMSRFYSESYFVEGM